MVKKVGNDQFGHQKRQTGQWHVRMSATGAKDYLVKLQFSLRFGHTKLNITLKNGSDCSVRD